MKKRTEGKIKNCLTFRDMYKFYKKTYPDEVIDYKDFSKIIKLSNLELIKVILEEAENVKLPYRLGSLQICRFNRSISQELNKLAVDWKKTLELGFKVYFDDKYIYKWTWKKHSAIVKNKTGYKFTASRKAKRLLPKTLRELKIQYYK